jgi:hypothetical protein
VEGPGEGDDSPVDFSLVQVLHPLDPSHTGAQAFSSDGGHFWRSIDSGSVQANSASPLEENSRAAADIQHPDRGSQTAELFQDELVVVLIVMGWRVQVIPRREASEQLVSPGPHVLPLFFLVSGEGEAIPREVKDSTTRS